MTDEALDFRLTATDLASAKFAGLNKQLGATQGASVKASGGLSGFASNALAAGKQSILMGIGLGAGVTAFNVMSRAIGGVTDFLGDSVRAAMEEESSIASLTAALKANVAGYNGDNTAIEKVIESRLKLGYTDNLQREQLGALVAMTKDSAAALEIEGIAMDAAAITGKDFGSINIALGKAFTGNTAALKKLGIVVDAGTKGYDLLAAVQKRFAGGAEAASNTTAGALKGMGVEFDRLQEDVGKAFLPLLTDLAKLARDTLIPALRDLTQTVKDAKPVWVVVGRAIDGIGTQLGLLLTPVRLAGEAIGVLIHHFDDGFSELPVIVDRGVEASRRALAIGGQAMVDNATATGDAIPRSIADAMLAKQQVLKDAGAQLVKFMADALSPAQVIARDKGFLASSELAAGLADNNPLVRQKAVELRDAAIAEIAQTAGFTTGGYKDGVAWVTGFKSSYSYAYSSVYGWLAGLKQLLVGSSPPPEGPLHKIDMGGFNIGKAWSEGFAKGIGPLNLPVLGLGGMSLGGGFTAPGGGGLAMAAAASGSPVVIQLQVDGRTLAEIVDRQLYYKQSGSSRFPRG